MKGAVILSGIFIITLIVAILFLAIHLRSWSGERDKHYRDEISHIKEEIQDLKEMIKNGLVNLVNKLK